MAKRKQYSEREKQAYHAGRGYAAGKSGKRVKCKTEREKQSFRNGVKSVRKNHKSTHTRVKPSQKFDGTYGNRSSEIVCGITADGELVGLK